MVRDAMSKGMNRDQCLEIVDLSKNQFYYTQKGTKPGRRPSTITKWRDPKTLIVKEVNNEEVILRAVEIKLDPDHAKWYRLITATLNIRGYYINHKKLFRLMKEYLLLEDRIRPRGKEYVKYRRVSPTQPLKIIEMDIKYIWIYEENKYAFVLTIIDTFTRYVLHWKVGYTMKSEQVKQAWEYIFAQYLQPNRLQLNDIEVEVRNDNGKQFEASLIRSFFEENSVRHQFTRPYTPEENGHVESFHSILTSALEKDKFSSLKQLETRLNKFYTTYNNDRSHSGTKGIPPAKFWALYDLNKLEVIKVNPEKKIIKIKLKVAYQDILTLPGILKHQYRVIRSRGRPSP
jgi:putative transposase